MLRQGMTIKEATEYWVRGFNAIPQSIIERAHPDMDGLKVLVASEEYGLPMWGTMWTFEDTLDDDWVRENLETMQECGFCVYESDELGIVIGIDGAGYNFYEAHWIPFYKARGLHWHDEEVGE